MSDRRATRNSISEEVVHAWVERTCAEQGVPVFVTDPLALAKVVTILRAARNERLRAEAAARKMATIENGK